MTRNRWVILFRAVLTALLATAVLSGCNTVRGVGKDIEKAGEKIRKAAD